MLRVYNLCMCCYAAAASKPVAEISCAVSVEIATIGRNMSTPTPTSGPLNQFLNIFKEDLSRPPLGPGSWAHLGTQHESRHPKYTLDFPPQKRSKPRFWIPRTTPGGKCWDFPPIYVYIHTYTYTYTNVHTYMYVYAYVYIYIYMDPNSFLIVF